MYLHKRRDIEPNPRNGMLLKRSTFLPGRKHGLHVHGLVVHEAIHDAVC